MTPSPIPPGPSVVSPPLVRGVPADLSGLAPNGDDQFVDHQHYNMSANTMTHQQQQPSQQPYLSNQCRNSMSISNTKGLLNMPGQNNCFLNSAVQVLWHLDIFRRSFRELTGHACMADSCIFCALKELFAQFQYSRETALPPDALRRALAETFFDQRRFQLGFMDDAAECFENILSRIHCHIAHQESEDMCNAGHCIPHQKFAMTIVEQTVCHACGATSEPLPFNQMVHYVSASALCAQARVAKQNGIDSPDAFGNLMKTAGGMGDIRDCPSSCGAKIQIQKTLMNHPEIFSVGLVWDSERPTLEHIMDVFDTIGLTIKLQNVFHSVVDKSWAMATTHNLVGVVTYYGKHYSTFFFHSKLGVWIYFDDAAVREIGPHWEQVVEKCRRGHFQPLLLLYADPKGTPVSVGSAPRAITYIPGQRKLIGPNPVTDHLKGRLSRSGTPSDSLSNALTPTPHVTYLNPAESNTRDSRNGGTMVEQCTCRNDKRSYEECDIHGTYISRKAVEHVLNFQKLQRQRSLNGSFTSGHGSVGSRNSSSSLESFENNNCVQQQQQVQQQKNNALAALDCKNKAQTSNPQSGMPSNLPRRRDSGNWSGDRNSASSASSTSLDNPYVFNANGRRPFYNVGPGGPVIKNRLHDPTNFTLSDQGYDSFSLSSTDSYPSIGNGSPLRIDNRLGQILENVQLDLPNETKAKQGGGEPNSSNKQAILCLEDCDKLCAEADLLLMKSNEKEHEGDLPMAALYSDAAAAKARQAMDAPYNNNQSMVSAKMKHSLCVMRSSNIHRRIKEAEAEERRKQKEQQSGLEIHHHRQSSRDSNHSRHSRQSSRDSTKQSSSSLSKSNSGGSSRQGSVENFEKLGRGIEIYATLPKKGSKKKSASYEDVLSKNFADDTATFNSKPEPIKNNHADVKIASPQTPTIRANKKAEISDFFYSKDPPELSGDYWMRQEQIYPPQITKSPLVRTLSGPANLKDVVEQPAKEILPPNKKQHKIRRKLMGGLMRRKNRSLPDLREGQDQSDAGKSSAYDDSEIILGLISPKSRERKLMNIPTNLTSDYLSEDNSYAVSRGFHQPHRAFVNRDYLQRPLLMKVTPPKVELLTKECRVPASPTHHDTYKGRNTPLDVAYQVKKPEVIYQNQMVHNQLVRQKTVEDNRNNCDPTLNPRSQNTQRANGSSLMSPMVERRLKTPRMSVEVALVAKDSQHPVSNAYVHQESRLKSSNSLNYLPPPTTEINLAKRKSLTASVEELPVANSSFLAELQAKRSQILELSPTKTKTTIEKECVHPKGNFLDELQKKQQHLQIKQKESDIGGNQEERPIHVQNVSSQNQGQNQMQSFDVPDGSYALHQSPSHTSTAPKPTIQYKQPTSEENKAKSVVKDLASRFEHILYVKPQTTQETLGNPQDRISDSNPPRCGLPVANNAVNERTSLIPGRLFTLTSSMTQQATHYPAPYSPSAAVPQAAPIPNGDTFDIRSSPSIAAPRRDPSPMTHLSAHKLSPSPQECDVRRPQRPPDYETAIQRLGLIRDIRSASPMEINKQEHYNAIQQEPSKKTRGPKKSVTFSDQVVLVACAEDEESDYLPNPLLERVYKQHNMRNDSETDGTRSNIPQTLNRTENVEDTVLCNLCHQQRVKIQAVYCPDCSFYMARFSPKK